MRVAQLGAGQPSVAIVGAIHGDEPCGARAIERLIEDDPPVRRPVKLIIANAEALERDVRYVDADLNRAFDDGVPEDALERDLAHQLASELRGMTAISIHSTQSYPYPFAIASRIDDYARDIASKLSVRALVDTGSPNLGRVFEAEADIIEVEAGLQKSDAATENAYRLVREFLTATRVLPGETTAGELPVYRMGEPIEKPDASAYEVFVENFTRVEANEPFAAADGTPLSEPNPFYPILLSSYGYADIFGFRGQKLGTVTPGQRESDGASSTRSRSRSNAQ
ncbi:M14 family metallopeptidase [Halanaeroarchaeum sulfurireducens]|uniref:succinylglutamate desuccinylase/aspartoacylase domain-containing protein n=1 Tax=Halanaeroarchaeum sulfurireducens TaxID=1604004 RepID=UPI0006794909|nr:succinylglutamate desuccinylase/aspartoacylase family protein [Halanaeroarchaeum sulfurireducens]